MFSTYDRIGGDYRQTRKKDPRLARLIARELRDAETIVNVGAGTITCNYDGFDKHRTEIGAGAFVGSNSSLVAPVKIGRGAYIGSGSVVTRDVPDEALALERSQQTVREGWGKRFREMKLLKRKPKA